MAHRLLPTVKDLKARRALARERRAADDDLVATPLPPIRLAWRVQELVADGNRLELARCATELVHDADRATLPGASPVNRVAVRSARANLLALASRLADLDRPVTARGVLLAERLLSDAGSPFYDRNRARAARRETDAARQALERRTV
jgi:hypothetical protein